MEKNYKVACSVGTYVYSESTVKALFHRTEINDIVIAELEQHGIWLTPITQIEVDNFWKKEEEARIKREESCSCADCGCGGNKNEMEYGHNGYVCSTCWNSRAMKMM